MIEQLGYCYYIFQVGEWVLWSAHDIMTSVTEVTFHFLSNTQKYVFGPLKETWIEQTR